MAGDGPDTANHSSCSHSDETAEKDKCERDRKSLSDLKASKKNLKTKLTRARMEVVSLLTKDDSLERIKTAMECTSAIYCDLVDVLDRLLELDSANATKYDSEVSDIERICDEITTSATKYIYSHEKGLLEPIKTVPAKVTTESPTTETVDSPSTIETVDSPTTETADSPSTIKTADSLSIKTAESPSTKQGDRPLTTLDRDMIHQLKRVSIATFNGNKKEYRLFRDAFDECIAKSSLSPAYKMLQLRQYLAGDAKKTIEGLPATELGFKTALDKLDRKYGGERRFLIMHLDNVRSAKPVTVNDLKDLEDFNDKLELAVVSLKENKRTEEFDNDSMFYCVAKSKLPEGYIAHYKRWLVQKGKAENVESLLAWLENEIRVRNEAKEEGQGPKQSQGNVTGKSKSRSFTASANHKPQSTTCIVCNASHKIYSCPIYESKSIDERWAFAKQHRLCYRCLGASHRGAECRSSRSCPAPGCKKTHHRLLHSDNERVNSNLHAQAPTFVPMHTDLNSASHTASTSQFDQIAMRIVPVILTNKNKEIRINALLDEGSTDSYISEAVAAELGLDGPDVSRNVTVLGGNTTLVKGRRVPVGIMRADNRQPLGTIKTFTVGHVTGDIDVINWNEHKNSWPHLENIPFPKIARPKTVDLLIGLNDEALDLHSSLQEVHGTPGQPIARLTPLGWTCIGRVPSSNKRNECFMASISYSYHCSYQNDSLTDILKRTWEIDSQGLTSTDMSPKDVKIDKRTEETIRLENGRYQIGIPWKKDEPRLPQNWHMAANRLQTIEKALMKKPKVAQEYGRIIHDYEHKGYVRRVTNDDDTHGGGWLLPHFPVVRLDKETTKVRIVMDAAAKCANKSLNDCIDSGPKLQSDLLDVLIRFRRRPIAISADISEMFLQIEMDPDSRMYHRFLWRDMDVTRPPDVYEFNRLVFGNTASPYLSQKVLRTHATKNKDRYPLGANSILASMYVDDLLDSEVNANTAIELRHQITDLLREAGFTIRKWVSNDIAVLADIPDDEKATHVNIEDGILPSVKTLGLVWDAESDSYVFLVRIPKLSDMTKRTVFSASATLFDPLNFLSPYTIRARTLMQESWIRGLGWDEPLPEPLRKKWETWFSETGLLSEIKTFTHLLMHQKMPMLRQFTYVQNMKTVTYTSN